MHFLLPITFLIAAVASTPVPANRALRSSGISSSSTPTFSTIDPTYTPSAPVYKRQEEVKIMFNNKRELEDAANQPQGTKTITTAEVTGQPGSAVEEYQLS